MLIQRSLLSAMCFISILTNAKSPIFLPLTPSAFEADSFNNAVEHGSAGVQLGLNHHPENHSTGHQAILSVPLFFNHQSKQDKNGWALGVSYVNEERIFKTQDYFSPHHSVWRVSLGRMLFLKQPEDYNLFGYFELSYLQSSFKDSLEQQSIVSTLGLKDLNRDKRFLAFIFAVANANNSVFKKPDPSFSMRTKLFWPLEEDDDFIIEVDNTLLTRRLIGIPWGLTMSLFLQPEKFSANQENLNFQDYEYLLKFGPTISWNFLNRFSLRTSAQWLFAQGTQSSLLSEHPFYSAEVFASF